MLIHSLGPLNWSGRRAATRDDSITGICLLLFLLEKSMTSIQHLQ